MANVGVSLGSLLGTSRAMEELRAFAKRAAQVNVPVLILGETGTGKSLLGRVIHNESARANGPYLAINCAGIPDSLFESEFFGHQRGAFTGARENRRGIMEQAQGGSLFLDEVGELSVPQQAKLLTALEDGEVRRLGSEGTVRVDVRVLAATSRDLFREMSGGGFRRELYHRLAVLACYIPPLRDRSEDVALLARRFLKHHQRRHNRPPSPLSPKTQRYLESRLWPGNVRELSHLLEAALILSEGGTVEVETVRAAEAMALQGEDAESRQATPGTKDLSCVPSSSGDLETLGTLDTSDTSTGRGAPSPLPGAPYGERYAFMGSAEEERELIRLALVRARGNKTRAAKDLGMARNTLRHKLRRYGLG